GHGAGRYGPRGSRSPLICSCSTACLTSGSSSRIDPYVQAAAVARACGTLQHTDLAWPCCKPADHSMAVTQGENLAAERQAVHAALWTHYQNLTRIQSGCTQPSMTQILRRLNQRQPARCSALAQIA